MDGSCRCIRPESGRAYKLLATQARLDDRDVPERLETPSDPTQPPSRSVRTRWPQHHAELPQVITPLNQSRSRFARSRYSSQRATVPSCASAVVNSVLALCCAVWALVRTTLWGARFPAAGVCGASEKVRFSQVTRRAGSSLIKFAPWQNEFPVSSQAVF